MERGGDVRGLVCFSDGAGRYDWLCRWLRPGFRHCWLAVNTEAGWILVDPRAHWLEVEWLARPDFDLAAFYRSEGVAVVPVEIVEPPRRGYPVFLWTCVETVKRALGIRAWWCWTPYQLWRLLDGEAVRTGLVPRADQ